MEHRLIVHSGLDSGDVEREVRDALTAEHMDASVRVTDHMARMNVHLAKVEMDGDIGPGLPKVAARLAAAGVGLEMDRDLVPLRSPREAPSIREAPRVPLPVSPDSPTGKGVAVAVIDSSGIKAHAAFAGRLRCFDVTADTVEPAQPGIGPGQTHGTAVASVAVGAGRCAAPARDATLWYFRATCAWQMSRVLDYLLTHATGIRVICTAEQAVENPLNQRMGGLDLLRDDARSVHESGAVMCAAAGNEGGQGGGRIRSPAIYPSVIAVGAYDDRDFDRAPTPGDRVHAYSSRGPDGAYKPDLLTRWGPYVTAGGDPDRADDYGAEQGTSMAVGHAAGLIATWFEADPALTASDVRRVLSAPGSCLRLRDGPREYPPNDQGYGALLAGGALKEVLDRRQIRLRSANGR